MNSRKKKNRIMLLLILLLCISIGFAYLSTTLNVGLFASINKNAWNVYLDSESIVVNPNSSSDELPTVRNVSSALSIISWNVVLDVPGDFYEFTVDVKNGGTINAKIAENGVTNSTLTQTQDTYVNYSVAYSDGTPIAAGDKLSKSGATISGIGDTRTIKVRVEYDPSVTPAQINALEDDITLTLNFGLNYVQD